MTGALLSGRPDMGGQFFISLSILIPPFSVQATLSGNGPNLFLACRVMSEEHFYSPFCLPSVYPRGPSAKNWYGSGLKNCLPDMIILAVGSRISSRPGASFYFHFLLSSHMGKDCQCGTVITLLYYSNKCTRTWAYIEP
jgi:hypothetical protein